MSSLNSALANLAHIGKLKAEPPDRCERANLLRSAEVRLQDARQSMLSIESRFDLAYNAAHAAALCALRLHGYRSEIATLSFNVSNTRSISLQGNGNFLTKHIENEILPNMKETLILLRVSSPNLSIR